MNEHEKESKLKLIIENLDNCMLIIYRPDPSPAFVQNYQTWLREYKELTGRDYITTDEGKEF